MNVQVDDCGAELTEHTARVPPLGPRPGETLQQHHDARAFLAQLRELGLEKRLDRGFPVPDGTDQVRQSLKQLVSGFANSAASQAS